MPTTSKYDTEIKNAHKETSEFFGFSLNNIKITVAENRNEYEKLLGKKTADWETGHANPNKKTILLLDPAQWEKEAPSHKPEEFPFTIRHEIAHIYINHLSDNKTLPVWLTEGLAGAISGQYKNAKNKYFEDNFCSKLDTYFNWNQRTNSGAYPTSFLFSRYLIDKYGFKTIEKLIQSVPRYYSYSRFNKIVVSVFGKNLTELEEEFLDNLE